MLALVTASCNDDPAEHSIVPTYPSFVVTPTSGLTTTEFGFDASSTSDREDPTSAIEVRS